jgi:hypothetical protein
VCVPLLAPLPDAPFAAERSENQSADYASDCPSAGFQEGIEEGKFGAPGRGIERAVAGGMHSLVVDEAGKVSPDAGRAARLRPILAESLPLLSVNLLR